MPDTTAAIHYHPNSNDPAFVLIDGDDSRVLAADYDTERTLVGARIRAIDHACRRLGWKVADTAAIVRQADGRGTIRVEPLSLRPGKAGPEPLYSPAENALRSGVARVTQRPEGVAGMSELTIAVDGQLVRSHVYGSLDSLDPWEDAAARGGVDDALASIAYLRTGPLIHQTGTPAWQCSADPVGAVGKAAEGTSDWTEQPTLVRITDSAATALNEAADKLGIPGDELATAWIRGAAASALRKYGRDIEPGLVAEGNRIVRWRHDGSAVIEPEEQQQ
jgi:hypothetical protein